MFIYMFAKKSLLIDGSSIKKQQPYPSFINPHSSNKLRNWIKLETLETLEMLLHIIAYKS